MIITGYKYFRNILAKVESHYQRQHLDYEQYLKGMNVSLPSSLTGKKMAADRISLLLSANNNKVCFYLDLGSAYLKSNISVSQSLKIETNSCASLTTSI